MDGSRRRDRPSPLRTPPGYDAPRTHALLGRFGRLESYPCLQQPSPLAPSLTSSPPAVAPCLVLVRHSPSPDPAAAARNTHVRSSPLSSGATTNQRSRPPRPPRRTRTGPCRPYTAPVTSAASTLRSARCSRLAAVKTRVQYALAPRIPQWYAFLTLRSRGSEHWRPSSRPFGHEPLWLTLREKGVALRSLAAIHARRPKRYTPTWDARSVGAPRRSSKAGHHARPAWCSHHGRTNREGGRSEVS